MVDRQEHRPRSPVELVRRFLRLRIVAVEAVAIPPLVIQDQQTESAVLDLRTRSTGRTRRMRSVVTEEAALVRRRLLLRRREAVVDEVRVVTHGLLGNLASLSSDTKWSNHGELRRTR